jgi:acyl-CoA synthetase (NDP forming)
VRALARVVEYSVWLRHPVEDSHEPGANAHTPMGKRLVNELLMKHPEGKDLDEAERAALLAAYDIDVWPLRAVDSLEAAVAAGEELGWDVVLKATHERLRNRPDLAHVWRNIDTAVEMADAWTTLNSMITDPGHAGFVVQKNAPPGVPVAIASMEDPLFGPVISFSISGVMTELLADRSFRIPPLTSQDAADMVREIKSSPLLFGYRGSEVVDVAEIERLITRASQLQHDLPQVRSLDLSLVLAGAEGVSVLTTAIRVEPVRDPRSDWFVRRMSTLPGDTLPE